MRDGTCKLLSAEEKILRNQGHFNRLHELSADEIHNVGGGVFENIVIGLAGLDFHSLKVTPDYTIFVP